MVAAKKSTTTKKKGVKWGKSTVTPAVKSYVDKAIKQNEETKYLDIVSTVYNTTDTVNYYSQVVVPYPNSSSPNYNSIICPLNFNQYYQGGTASAYSGSAVAQFEQGTDNYCQYVGDSIKISAIKLNMEFTRNALSAVPDIKGYIVKESEVANRSSLGTIGDLAECIFNGNIVTTTDNFDFLAFRPVDAMGKLKNWKILKTFDLNFNNVNLPSCVKRKSITIKLKDHKQTMADIGTDNGIVLKDRIWLVMFGHEPNADYQTKVKFQSRMYYKDA